MSAPRWPSPAHEIAADPMLRAEALELMLDQIGLGPLLTEIAGICHEKASHVEEAWGDMSMAMAWSRVARRLSAVSGEHVVKHLVRVTGNE